MDFFEIYDALIADMGEGAEKMRIERAGSYSSWAMAETADTLGIAMAGDQAAVAPMFDTGIAGLTLNEAAEGVKSWNLREAGVGLAAINAWYNTPANIAALGAAEPYENHAMRGLSFDGAIVGIVGHMHLTPEVHRNAMRVYTLERAPKAGDYPDSACELLLPQCDYVFITGSALVNKTLPRLVELSRNAYTVLLGPSVPLCPALLAHGIDRLSGMAVCDNDAMRRHVTNGIHGNPYSMGTPFLLTK